LLAGEYPGAREHDTARWKLEKLVDAGIRQVVNLMEKNERDHAGMAFTPYEKILAEIAKERNIKTDVRRFPVVDMRCPTPGKMGEILDFIDEQMEDRIPVYVHCWGGIGRTGTVVGCFLIRHGLAHSTNVVEKIRRLRILEERRHRASPESRLQQKFIENWHHHESGPPSRLNRYIGCMTGGAVGDALGAPVEFLKTEDIRQIYGSSGITDYDEAFGRIGAITDDTQMTLFTAEGLLRAWTRGSLRGVCHPPSMVYKACLRWLRTQLLEEDAGAGSESSLLLGFSELFSRRAPGASCQSALESGRMGTPEEPVNNSKGCGGVTRVAPAGLIQGTSEDAFRLGCDLAALTHGHPTGYLAGGMLAALIHEIRAGSGIADALEKGTRILKSWPQHEEFLSSVDRAVTLARKQKPDPESIQSLGKGWVAEEALAISLFCALGHEDDFPAGVLAAVNHDGDSDSTGAITGNLLGCRLGASSIPAGWTEGLELHELIQAMAVDLFIRFRDDRAWWERYPGD
jgi:ADP-ribosylglycohydrolase/predicted protein tyrosine phosphatase